MDIEVDENRTIVVRDHFRTSRLLKLREKAEAFTDKLLEIFLEDQELQDEVDLDEDADQEEVEEELERLQELEASERIAKIAEEGFQFAMKLSLSELQALHEFCAEMTVEVEGFTDEDGNPFTWDHMEEDRQVAFYDKYVPHLTKVWLFINCYLRKSGMLSASDLEEGEEAEEGDDS